jgi:hypothetical protein
MAQQPDLAVQHPDIYRSEQDALAHGATIAGAEFGRVNVQAWANATCTTIRSATDFVILRPNADPAISIQRNGQWIDVSPQGECACDPATGRVAGPAPTRAEMVTGWTNDIDARVGAPLVRWHQLVQVLRGGIPRETEVVGPHGEVSSNVRPGTLPARLREEMRERVATQGSRRGPLERQYSEIVLEMLHVAGERVRPPAPLTNTPMPEHLHVRIRAGGNWAAVTQPHLGVVSRGDFWHWIVFNDAAIGETPEFTRTVIEHELEHAADLERELQAFERTHPRPTTDPPRQYGYPANSDTVQGWRDEWGQYINAFTAFRRGQTPASRHFEIVVGQRRGFSGPSTWGSWSAQERAYWFELAFNEVPPDVAAGTALPGEAEVVAAFTGANDALKAAAVERAYTILDAAVSQRADRPRAENEEKRARARTLIQHFDPIMDQVFTVHSYLPRRPMLQLLREAAPGR